MKLKIREEKIEPKKVYMEFADLAVCYDCGQQGCNCKQKTTSFKEFYERKTGKRFVEADWTIQCKYEFHYVEVK